MRRTVVGLRWLLAGAMAASVTQAQAQDSTEAGPDADALAPPSVSFEGLTGLMTVPTAETLPQGKFAIGAFYDWEIETDSRAQGDTDIHVVDLAAAVGLHDRFEVGLSVPFTWYERDDLTFDPDADLNIQKVGDIQVQAAFALIRRGTFLGQESSGATQFPLGLSLTAGYRFGSGDEEARTLESSLGIGESTGEDAVLVGGLVDLPIPLGGEKRSFFPGPILLTAGVGADIPVDDQSALGEDLEVAVTYHGGLQVPVYGGYYLPGEQLSLEGSIIGNTSVLEADDKDPLAAFAGLRYEVGNGFALGGGVRAALTGGIDDYRGLVTLSYAGIVPRPAPKTVEVVVEKEVMVPAPVPAPIVRERLILPDVNFAFDEATLTPLGKGKIYLLANLIKDRQVESIVIEGHADERGPEEYNMKLAERRAAAVKAELIKLGVPSSWLSVQSFGETMPLIPQRGEWAWSVNRRVEVLITPKGGEVMRGLPAASE